MSGRVKPAGQFWQRGASESVFEQVTGPQDERIGMAGTDNLHANRKTRVGHAAVDTCRGQAQLIAPGREMRKEHVARR